MNARLTLPLPVKVVMIDLDGTLVDSIPDLAAAANAMLTELGREVLAPETIKGYVGNGVENLVTCCLGGAGVVSAGDLARALPVFRRHYKAVNGRQTTVFPGVREGLQAMRAMGLQLACVTNKAAAFTEPLLRHMNLREFFTTVVSGDTLPEKKPHPMPLLHICRSLGVESCQGLLIGDSQIDVVAARSAGCPVFCVSYGYREGSDVHELGCDAIVASLAEAAARLVRATDASGSAPGVLSE